MTPLIQARGVYSVFGGVLIARMGLCALFVLLGARADPQTAALFLLANRVASETVCRISPLVLSDLVRFGSPPQPLTRALLPLRRWTRTGSSTSATRTPRGRGP